MAKSLLIKVEPAVLQYARKFSGYKIEDIAKKAKIPGATLQIYEDQGAEIPLSHLEKFANIYKRPLAFFLLSKVPGDAVVPKEFRIVFESDEESFSPSAYLAIRRARYVQSVIAELADGKFEYKFPSVTTNDDVDKLAAWFRDYVGVPFEKQRKWSTSGDALRGWKNALEAKDIFVLQQSIAKDHVSAFSLVDKKPYVLLLNSSEHEVRRVFSLFHEIGHILLHSSGICSPEDLSRNSYQYVHIEKFCNQFSASFLVPKDLFLTDSEVSALRKIAFEEWEDDDIKSISQHFKVSKEVILRRFHTLNLISDSQYEQRRARWLKENAALKKPKKEFKLPMYQKVISQNGRKFTGFVLDQYHANRISFSAAAEILNVNPKHMQRLEAKI